MTGTGRFAVGATAAVALVLAGCGGSDGGGDAEAFCEQIRAIDAADEAVDDDLAAAAVEFEALIDDAPDEIKNDLRIVVDAFTELDELDEDDPEAFEQFLELLQRPDFVDATETLEQFGVDECGLEPATGTEVPSEEPDDAEEVVGVHVESIGDDSDDGSVKTTTVPGDPYDEEFWGPIDPDEISIPGIEQHLDVNYPDEGWFGGSVNGSSLSDGLVVIANLEGDDAVRLCDAVLEYAGAIDPDVSVRVEDDASTLGAAGTVAEGCA